MNYRVMKDIKVTAVVLTYNEEKRIEAVLQALNKFDTIIVWDKSSTDRTVEIAKTYGAKIFRVEYYNDTIPIEVQKRYREFLFEEQDNEWVLSLTASDIVHIGLYDEIVRNIREQGARYSVMEVPIYRYSMGIEGKHTFYGGIQYQADLYRREMYPTNGMEKMIHESFFKDMAKCKVICKDQTIAIYHLTHPDLPLIMDRHWRYAVQYVIDSEKHGRDRKRVMRYSIHECIRLVGRYFKNRIYKSGETGKAQLMMLLMYNCMIYLNAFFDNDREQKIKETYVKIARMCEKGEE